MENLNDILQYELMDIKISTYLYSFLCILGSFMLKWFLSLVLWRLESAAKKTRTGLDDLVLSSLSQPLGWACVLAGIYFATTFLPLPAEPVDVRRFVNAFLKSASIALTIWFLVLIVDGLMDRWAARAAETDTRLDDQLVPILRGSTKTFLIIIGVVLFLQNMGYSVSSLLAGLGLGGMAIALASKDVLANLFGSVVIFVDKPFQVGDWIEMGDVEGTVEEVNIRVTRIRTFANSLITVPNSSFTTTSINNWSRMRKRRIMMTIGVTYDTPAEKLEAAVQSIRDIITEDDNILNDFFLVTFNEFGPSSLNILVYCFTATTVWGDYLQAKQDFMLKVMREFEKLDVDFAFPTQTLHIASMPQEGGGADSPNGA